MHDNNIIQGQHGVEDGLQENIRAYSGDGGELICPDLNANNGAIAKGGDTGMERTSELQILQEKVRALERQNAELKQARRPSEIESDEKGRTLSDSDASGRTTKEGSDSSVDSLRLEDMKLIDVNSLEGEEGTWLVPVSGGGEREWLRGEVEATGALIVNKKTLVNRLDDIARRSPSRSRYQRGSPNSSLSSGRSMMSPPLAQYLKSQGSHPISSTPSAKYQTSPGVRTYDSRTFRRGQRTAGIRRLISSENRTFAPNSDIFVEMLRISEQFLLSQLFVIFI